MIHRIVNYIKYSVNFFDILNSNILLRRSRRTKLIVGLHAVYPPFYNGAAIFLISLVEKLIQRRDIQLVAIPYKKRIDKKMFDSLPIAGLKNKYFDFIIFFPSHYNLEKVHNKAKKIAWNTIHHDYGSHKGEQESIDLIKKSNLALAPTRFAMEQLKKAKVRKKKYLPLGVDLSKRRFTQNKEKNVLFVSRSHHYKGLMPFLDSVPLILKEIPETKFYLHSPLDKSSPYLDEIENRMCELKKKHPNNFFYETKWVSFEELNIKFQRASILIFPSNNEGFGLPLVEAMASGAVCITSDLAPMNELVENEVTGICLPTYKQKKYPDFEFPKCEDIANQVVRLLKNEQLRRKMAKIARIKVEKEYNLDKIVEKLINILKTFND